MAEERGDLIDEELGFREGVRGKLWLRVKNDSREELVADLKQLNAAKGHLYQLVRRCL